MNLNTHFQNSVGTSDALTNITNPAESGLTIYVDGSSLDNPGPAGWAVLVQYPDGTQRTASGGAEVATNNQMELQAATEGLRAVPADATGVMRTDSEYVSKGLNVWSKGWIKRNWTTAQGKPVANGAQWRELLSIAAQRPGIRVEWVRGHNGTEGNETVDRLARDEATKRRVGGMLEGIEITPPTTTDGDCSEAQRMAEKITAVLGPAERINHEVMAAALSEYLGDARPALVMAMQKLRGASRV
jgi:ribonuclease HI